MILPSGNLYLQGRSVIEGYVTPDLGSTTLVNPFADALDDFLKNSSENSGSSFQQDIYPVVVVNPHEFSRVALSSQSPLSFVWLEESLRYNIDVLPLILLLPLILNGEQPLQSAAFADPIFPVVGSFDPNSLTVLGVIMDSSPELEIAQNHDQGPIYLDDLLTPFSLDPLSNIDMIISHDLNLSGILML